MTTANVDHNLDNIEKAREKYIAKLPWYKQVYRRCKSKDGFYAWVVSGLQTWATAFPAGLAASVKFPWLLPWLTKTWGYITAFASATLTVLKDLFAALVTTAT